VKKADGGWRLCTDYRKLNAVTKADPFPLPRIVDLLNKIGNAKYLTKVDMVTSGFFRLKYMHLDLRNVPATFSRLVTRLRLGLEYCSLAYLDDILIFSDFWFDYLKHLRLVFRRIRDRG